MDNTNKISIKEDNKCSGRNCTKIGKTILKIRYINKTGLFCDSCAEDLLEQGLALKICEVAK